MTEIISASPARGYREIDLPQGAAVTPARDREKPMMPDLLGSGLTWQQFLALGLVGTFVGAVKFLDALYQRSVRSKD